MNDLGLIVLGAAARATVLAAIGLILAAALRRRGPEAGASASLASLAVLVGVSALAVSPWPRWWSPGDAPTARPVAAPAPGPTLTGPIGIADAPPPAAAPGDRPVAVGPSWTSEFVRELARPAGPDRPSTARRWPSWMAWAFLTGLAVALARLGLGLRAVGTLRARSRPVDDPGLIGLVGSLRGAMGLRRAVEVRESDELATPATIGWRRPAILLPVGWAGWDDRERRAALAHELAHVLRGDYAAGIGSQVSLSLHFYHPLVHALAARLRLQQELAADAWGARLSGGRRPYLSALASLALRLDPEPAAWPARPLLPTRGTFFRRIEMLRDPRTLPDSPPPRRARALAVTAIIAAGLTVAGFRGPDGPGRALAQDPPLTKKIDNTGVLVVPAPALDPTSASSDVHLAIEVRPADLLKNPEFKKLVDQLPPDGPKGLSMIFSGDIEQVLVLGFDRQGGRPSIIPPQLVLVFRSARPIDWKPFIEPRAKEIQGDFGFTYYRAGNIPNTTCFRVLDGQTLMMGSEADVKLPPIGNDRPRGRHDWDDAWKKLQPGAVRVAFDTPWMVRQVQPGGPPNRRGPLSPITSIFGPLFDKTRAYALTLGAADGLTLDALATSDSEAGAGRVADTVRASLALARNALPDLRRMAEGGPPEAARPLTELVDALDAMLETAKVEQDKTVAKLHAQADLAAVATAARMLLPAVGASREAARRAQCVNNMKQIGLAMHNYASTNNCFPPAVLFGPDGKTPYSWRVAILPYLEQASLYNQYRFDELWDGPNNKKLLDKMPALYACPSDDQAVSSHFTSYFVPTGPDTIFPPRKEGTGFADITDGTSLTLLVVEAKREIPWTKPEDIPIVIDPANFNQSMPPMGGTHPGGFDALFADGSARFIKDSIAKQVLRALFTRAGGEVISRDVF